MQELEGLAVANPTELVLHVRELIFLASAGVRVLLMATKKLRAGVPIYVIAPREGVLETIRRAALLNSVVILDRYPATE
jgi:anti-anti-sigma regulatory factor